MNIPLSLGLLIKRRPILLGLNRPPIPHLDIPLLLQIRALLLVRQTQALQQGAIQRLEPRLIIRP